MAERSRMTAAPKRKRRWTPICPQPRCGSVRVIERAKLLCCEDCGFAGASSKFNQSSIHLDQRGPATHWRDGAALSMDGIEG